MQTFTAHLSAIDGAYKISGVDVLGGAILEACEALALSCTLVCSFIIYCPASSHELMVRFNEH